jgi:thiamine kinase-like enzyme
VLDNGFKIPHDYLEHAGTFGRIRDALTATDQTTVPCNNDLLAENFIEEGDRIWIIDYEYSGNNDPCFELGNIWSECGLSTEQLDNLVTAYYGRPLRHKTARAHLQGIVAKYGWTLWGCIQNASSTLEVDFWSWAMERYEAAVAEFNAPHIARLLEDVHATD